MEIFEKDDVGCRTRKKRHLSTALPPKAGKKNQRAEIIKLDRIILDDFVGGLSKP